jgi:uncharacterized protein YkwD
VSSHIAIVCRALLLVLAATVPTGRAHGDPYSAVNLARRSGCGLTHVSELRRSYRLDTVAWRMAGGEPLHRAMLDASYRATTASAMHLVGTTTDQTTAGALAGHYCRDLSDSSLSEVGIAQRGFEIWLVVAAPLGAPSPGSARSVSERVLTLVNAARDRGARCGVRTYPAAPPLQLAPALADAAREHANDMARFDYFDHQGHDGSSPADRVRRTGYTPRIVGENIAAGVSTADEVVAGWLASPDHCANMMNARYTEMGVAYATNVRSDEAIYWSQVFAARR